MPRSAPASDRRPRRGRLTHRRTGIGPRRPRRPRRAAAIALLGLAALTYAIFGGRLPWEGDGRVIYADVTANTELHIPSPVRVAGVDVGEVTQVSPIPGSPDAGRLTLVLDADAPTIHRGATATVRARTFLEGNFYLALTQGDPSAPVLGPGATLGAATGAGPVQLDRLLSSLDTPGRVALAATLRGLGHAFEPSAAAAINRSLALAPTALTSATQVTQAVAGPRPTSLTQVSRGLGATFAALAASGRALPGLIDGLSTTMSALAGAETGLKGTLAALPGTLRNADAAETGLDVALPRLDAFATALVPGLRRLDPTIGTTLPWLADLRRLLDGRHLGGLSVALTPALDHTAGLARTARGLLDQLDGVARCATRDLIPTGDATISDPGTGNRAEPVYRELLQSAVAVASAAGNLDGNGRYVRASVGGGSTLVQTPSLPINGPLFGNAVLSPLGSRPALSGAAPAVDLRTRCANTGALDLNAVPTGGTP